MNKYQCTQVRSEHFLINNKTVASLCRTSVPKETPRDSSLLLLPLELESKTSPTLFTYPPPAGPQLWKSSGPSSHTVKKCNTNTTKKNYFTRTSYVAPILLGAKYSSEQVSHKNVWTPPSLSYSYWPQHSHMGRLPSTLVYRSGLISLQLPSA